MNEIYTRNEEQIRHETSEVNSVAKRIETNLERLKKINKIQHVVSEDLVFELTTYGFGGREAIINHYRKLNPMTRPEDIDWLVGALGNPAVTGERLPSIAGAATLDIRGLEKSRLGSGGPAPRVAGRRLCKEDFVFSAKGKVKPTGEVLREIEEHYSVRLETKDQQALADLAAELESVIGRMGDLYRSRDVWFNISDFIQRTGSLPNDGTYKVDKLNLVDEMLRFQS